MRPNSPLNLDLFDATGSLPKSSMEWLERHLQAAAVVMAVQGELSVRVVQDQEMSLAHARFSGVEGTTDVLTFDLGAQTPRNQPKAPNLPSISLMHGSSVYVHNKSVVCSDILVCRDVAERESMVLGTSIERELLLYAIHGMLHCIGFDDHAEPDAERMHAMEDAVLKAVGVGPVYKPGR